MNAKIALLTILMVATSCSKNSNQQSELRHDLNRVVNDNNKFQWLEVEEGVFDEGLLEYASMFGEFKILPHSHKATERAQFWLDQIDTMLRAKYPEQLKNTPKPQAKLIVTDEVNAFVSPVYSCIDIPAQFKVNDADEPESENTAKYAEYDRSAQTFVEVYENEDGEVGTAKCYKTGESVEEQLKVLDWALATKDNECTYEYKDGTLFFAGKCKADFEGLKITNGISVARTSHWITFFTGLVEFTDEDQFVHVAAHELGHYYMSHVTLDASEYNHFYFMQEHNESAKPKRDENAHKLGVEILSGVQELTSDALPLSEVKDQKYHSGLYVVLKYRLANLLKIEQCVDGDLDCNTSCAQLSAIVDDKNSDVLITEYFPWVPLEEGKEKAYFEYEKILSQCLEESTVVEVGDEINYALNLVILKSFVETLGEAVSESVGDLTFDPSATVVIEELNQKLVLAYELIGTKVNGLIQKSIDAKIGWYTAEQEADELSLEWTHDLGIDPVEGIKFEVQLGNLFSGPKFGAISQEECVNLYENDWRNEKGEYVILPIVDFMDDHHRSCYRAFNMSREIEAHDFSGFANFKRPDAGSPWEDYVAMVKAEREGLDAQSGKKTNEIYMAISEVDSVGNVVIAMSAETAFEMKFCEGNAASCLQGFSEVLISTKQKKEANNRVIFRSSKKIQLKEEQTYSILAFDTQGKIIAQKMVTLEAK